MTYPEVPPPSKSVAPPVRLADLLVLCAADPLLRRHAPLPRPARRPRQVVVMVQAPSLQFGFPAAILLGDDLALGLHH